VANKSAHSDSLLLHRDVTRTVSKNTSAGFLRNKTILENKLRQNVTRPISRLQTRHVMRNFRTLQMHLIFRLHPEPPYSNFR